MLLGVPEASMTERQYARVRITATPSTCDHIGDRKCDDAWQKIEGHLGHLRGEAEVSAAGNFPFAGRVTGQLTTFEHCEYSHLDIKFSCSTFALGPKQAIRPPPRVITDETKRPQSVLLRHAGSCCVAKNGTRILRRTTASRSGAAQLPANCSKLLISTGTTTPLGSAKTFQRPNHPSFS